MHEDKIIKALSPYWPAATNRTGIPKRVLSALTTQQDNKCFYCEVTIGSGYRIWPNPNVRCTKPTVDHLIPVCHGGANTIDNLVMACDLCNKWKAGKGFKDKIAAKKYMKDVIFKKIKLVLNP
jgi:5-methylcytosine-specific restriction endonuclease McrA